MRQARDGSGENEYESNTYYFHIEHLLNAFMLKTTLHSEVQTIQELKELWQECLAEIHDMLTEGGFDTLLQHKNAAKNNEAIEGSEGVLKKKRGRPKGSKNKATKKRKK
jgi:hypothetical protein